MPAFGRVRSPFDPRDYHMRTLLAADPVPFVEVSKHWRPGPLDLDQDGVGACVGFSGANLEQIGPRRLAVTNQTGFDRYAACKLIDGMPNVEGTFIRALVEVYRSLGMIVEYRFAETPEDILEWVCTRGPVIVGTNWYESMSVPLLHPDGTVMVTGAVEGGHAYVIRGNNARRRRYTCTQSWGGWWNGGKGEFWIARDALNRLVFEEHGEAVGIVEKRL